jgi:hypothetical protein
MASGRKNNPKPMPADGRLVIDSNGLLGTLGGIAAAFFETVGIVA